jgi:hypothetical protein
LGTSVSPWVQVVIRMAAEGDRAAQYSQGCWLVAEANGFDVELDAADRSPKADAGLVLCTAQCPVAHNTELVVGGHLSLIDHVFVCRCQP